MAGNGKKNGRAKKVKASLENVAEYRHDEAKRKNNPPAKIAAEGVVPILPKIKYEYSPRLNPILRFDPTGISDGLPDLLKEAQRRSLSAEEAGLLADALRNQEPWLEWATKREKKSFEVDPVALHIHERISAQAILKVAARQDIERSLFADPEQKYQEAVQFYRHNIDWTNRLILGDSLQVMTSLARREDLAGKVQMIYMDPPYGIKFASNFQSEVGNRDVKDGEKSLTREPEMVKAYRDTWHLGVHSYLNYLRDRLFLAKDLLTSSGSIFVQIGEENLDRVRLLMDEVFKTANFVTVITVKKKANQKGDLLESICDYLLFYAKDKKQLKYRHLYEKSTDDTQEISSDLTGGGVFRTQQFPVKFEGSVYKPSTGNSWKTSETGILRLVNAERVRRAKKVIRYRRFASDFGYSALTNIWEDTGGASDRVYVVQTADKVIRRCILMTTDPGDLVFDPTCGSGTTAYVAEQWGRRWITTDTSRVSIAVARQRLLTSKFYLYEMRALHESDIARNPDGPWLVDPRKHVPGSCTIKCKSVPHITLKSIARNSHLDPIFDKHAPILEQALKECNEALRRVTDNVRLQLATKVLHKQKQFGRKAITDADRRKWLLPAKEKWEHWQVPFDSDPDWPKELSDRVWGYRNAWRTKMDEVNACITANDEQEEIVDQPERIGGVVRVSGPFTVEAVQPPEMSLGPPQLVPLGEFDGAPEEMETFEIREVETRADQEAQNVDAYLDQMLRLLKMDGVRFPNNKELHFHRLDPVLNGGVIHAEGRWSNGENDRDPDGKPNIGVVFGPQFGPVTAMQVEESVRQANRQGYDHLVIAGFSFDGAAQAVIAEAQLPKLKVHAAHIRPDVNPGMAGLLKDQPGSQLFSVFGQPRTKVEGPNQDGEYVVTMEGVDIYNPVENTITPTKADKVAAWFLDGDYDGRTLCITQAFFPDDGAWEKLSKALDGVVDQDRFEA
jgi:adenine-specific DNA-methyltransferase